MNLVKSDLKVILRAPERIAETNFGNFINLEKFALAVILGAASRSDTYFGNYLDLVKSGLEVTRQPRCLHVPLEVFAWLNGTSDKSFRVIYVFTIYLKESCRFSSGER